MARMLEFVDPKTIHSTSILSYADGTPVILFVKLADEIIVYCPDHGPFAVVAQSHLDGEGCPMCESDNNRGNQ